MDKNELFKRCLRDKVAFRSNECVDGVVFFALPGAKVDGHSFLEDAKNHGAQAAVISTSYSGETYGLECYRVEDALATLHATARYAVSEHDMRVVAITGSCGKTTTKEYTHAMLSTKYDVEKSPGTRNSQIGLPAALINMRKDAELYVFEMGMSQQGEIANLVSIAPPEVAAITMIGRAHLEFLGSIEAIARAKGEIFTSPKTKKKFIGESVEAYPFLAVGAESVKFTHFPELDPLPAHFHNNASVALAIAEYYGVDREKALAAVPKKIDEKRFSLSTHDGVYWLSDSYNSIPEALLAALQSVPKKEGRKIALLSQMAELGAASGKIHAEMGNHAAKYLDQLVCYGEDMKLFFHEFTKSGKEGSWYPSKKEAVHALMDLVQENDVVLVKGSNSERLWEVVPCSS